MNLERTEMILKTIDQLGMVTVKQLHEILKFGTYRNTCRVINRLSPYLNVIRSKQKIVYLNESGRNMIGSKKEMKKTQLMDHILMTNDVYIYFSSPVDWKREFLIEVKSQNDYDFGIKVKGLTTTKKRIIPDALFTRNGYVHLVEIDNTRSMQDNKKKVEKYVDMWPEIKRRFNQSPVLYFFTTTKERKRKLTDWLSKHNLRFEVKTFEEII